MLGVANIAARAFGQAIASYSLWSVRPPNVQVEGRQNVPSGPAIWVGWHSTNLLLLALHRRTIRDGRDGEMLAFVPPGIVGQTMRGWLTGVGGIEIVPLPKDGTGGAGALKQMARALARGQNVAIAVDGPRGPAQRVRPGALWLGRLAGCPIVPVGSLARPALRLPRWDRHIVPVPGAQVTAVIGTPLRVERTSEIDQSLLDTLHARLECVTNRASELLAASNQHTENGKS